MMRTLLNYSLCLLFVAGITIACIVSANCASQARLEHKIEVMTAHDEARSKYSIRPRFIFDEIDFRNDQWGKKQAALDEYKAAYIGPDKTARILIWAAVILAAGFIVERIGRRFWMEKPNPVVAPKPVRTRGFGGRSSTPSSIRSRSSQGPRPLR